MSNMFIAAEKLAGYGKRLGYYGELLANRGSLRANCQKICEKYRWSNLYRHGIVEEAVSNKGAVSRLVATENHDFVLDVAHSDGLHFQHLLPYKSKPTRIESPRGSIVSGSELTHSRINFFELDGLSGRITSEGFLGHPDIPTQIGKRMNAMTPEESNIIRDYILLRHNDREAVEKIWHKYAR